jgi:hypothetical protein
MKTTNIKNTNELMFKKFLLHWVLVLWKCSMWPTSYVKVKWTKPRGTNHPFPHSFQKMPLHLNPHWHETLANWFLYVWQFVTFKSNMFFLGTKTWYTPTSISTNTSTWHGKGSTWRNMKLVN